MNVGEIKNKYFSQLDSLDLDLIIADALKKPREFVLAHQEKELSKGQILKIGRNVARRKGSEPLAHILGYKEFYGLAFKVNKSTLIPRPETEQIVDLVSKDFLGTENHGLKTTIIDIGTGSGNIIVSLAKNLEKKDIEYFAADISERALRIAKKNIQKHKLEKKIKTVHSDLLSYFLKETKKNILRDRSLILVANLPYLSKKIYLATQPTVRNFEPESALLSSNQGLSHYAKLFKQIIRLKKIYNLPIACYLEFSPEQKKLLEKIIHKDFPKAKTIFRQDLTKKWRTAKIET